MSTENSTPEVTVAKTSRRGRPAAAVGTRRTDPNTGVTLEKAANGKWVYVPKPNPATKVEEKQEVTA